MKTRFAPAVFLLFTACSSYAGAASSAQDPLADAQRDYNAGRFNRAVDALTATVATPANDAQLHFVLGQCYYQLHQFSRAVTSLERSVQLAPNESEYHDWLGKAYGRRAEESKFLSAMGWAKKTHKEFEVAVELKPTNLEAQRDLIRFEMYAPGMVGGGDDKAIKHIEQLEKIDALESQLARGEFLNVKRHLAEADALFGKVLATHTDRIGVYFEAADYYKDHQATPQNIAKLDEAIGLAERIDSKDRRLKYYRGVFLVMQGKEPAQAETLLKSYVSTVPENADLPPHSSALEWLGKLYEAQHRFSEATEEYRAALALDPQNKQLDEALKQVQKR